jgi:hypothetical protein
MEAQQRAEEVQDEAEIDRARPFLFVGIDSRPFDQRSGAPPQSTHCSQVDDNAYPYHGSATYSSLNDD